MFLFFSFESVSNTKVIFQNYIQQAECNHFFPFLSFYSFYHFVSFSLLFFCISLSRSLCPSFHVFHLFLYFTFHLLPLSELLLHFSFLFLHVTICIFPSLPLSHLLPSSPSPYSAGMACCRAKTMQRLSQVAWMKMRTVTLN